MEPQEEILNNLISDKKTNWKEKAKFRRDNKEKLDKSAITALKILNIHKQLVKPK